jgi:hypothetical protein
MRLLIGLIRAVFILIGFLFVMAFAAVVLVIGGAYMLLSGRKPQFRVVRPQDFAAGPFGRPQGFEAQGPFERPPMKDVTPIPVAEIDSAH